MYFALQLSERPIRAHAADHGALTVVDMCLYGLSRLRLVEALAINLLLTPALAAVVSSPTNAERDAAAQRRAQERDAQLREQQAPIPDVLPGPAVGTAKTLPTGESPCFTIYHLEIKGDSAVRFGWVLDHLSGPQENDSPMGKCLGALGVGVLLERAQNALVAKGYVTSRILAQAQDLSTGQLLLTIVPGRIRAVRLELENEGTRTSLASALPARAGDILNLRDIEQALENFKRVPGADADIQITPADQPDQSDLVIRYRGGPPLRLSLSADDSGSKSTGRYQGSATLSWDNPLGLNDTFYLTQTHDLGGGDPGVRGAQGYTVHYGLPWGYWTLGLTTGENRYNQTITGVATPYVYSGTSGNTDFKLSRLVYRDAVRKSTLWLKGFERQSNNFIDDTEVQVQRRAVGGWEFGAAHKQFVGTATIEANLAHKRGTGDFGGIDAPEESTGDGTAKFRLWSADLRASFPFKWGAHALRYQSNLRLQGNETPLTTQDRFSIGGRYTVRGFDGESNLSGDSGWLLRQDLGWMSGESGHELYVGIDAGEVSGHSTESLPGKTLTGAVIGLRGSLKKLQYDLFVGAPLDKPGSVRTGETAAGLSLYLGF